MKVEDTRSRIEKQLETASFEAGVELLKALAMCDIADALRSDNDEADFPFLNGIVRESLDEDRPAPGLHQE